MGGCRFTITGVEDTRWWTYVQDVAGDVDQKEIAAKMEIDKSQITRWKQGFEPGIRFVTKFAHTYGRNVLEALIAAEIITEAEAALREVQVGQQVLTDDQLVDEIKRRLKR